MGLLVAKSDHRLHSICVTMPWKVRIVRGSRVAEKGRAVSYYLPRMATFRRLLWLPYPSLFHHWDDEALLLWPETDQVPSCVPINCPRLHYFVLPHRLHLLLTISVVLSFIGESVVETVEGYIMVESVIVTVKDFNVEGYNVERRKIRHRQFHTT
nr:hypothetical protein CFP56_78017 [Quercus suber]